MKVRRKTILRREFLLFFEEDIYPKVKNYFLLLGFDLSTKKKINKRGQSMLYITRKRNTLF